MSQDSNRVIGTPLVRRGSVSPAARDQHGGVAEWLMAADCKSAGLRPTKVRILPPPWGDGARGCSSVGRASAFQAEGRGFESRRPLEEDARTTQGRKDAKSTG